MAERRAPAARAHPRRTWSRRSCSLSGSSCCQLAAHGAPGNRDWRGGDARSRSLATLLDHQSIANFGADPRSASSSVPWSGIWLARSVKMTAMPQMVALLNGVGGAAAALVAAAEYHAAALRPELPASDVVVEHHGLDAHRRGLVHGKHDRVREAPGAACPARAITLPGPEDRQRRVARGGDASRRVAGRRSRRRGPWLARSRRRFRSCSGSSLVHSDRRRGHAGRHLAPELVSPGSPAPRLGFVLHNNVLIIGGALVGASGMHPHACSCAGR